MRLCGFDVGPARPFFLIAGPCVVESEALALDTAGALKEITAGLGMAFIYKSSYDKANRSSHESYRGPGLDEGLKILEGVRASIGVPVSAICFARDAPTSAESRAAPPHPGTMPMRTSGSAKRAVRAVSSGRGLRVFAPRPVGCAGACAKAGAARMPLATMAGRQARGLAGVFRDT